MRPPLLRFMLFFLMAAAAAAAPPNLLVLLADDQGWGDISLNGNTAVRTPNIDALARAGASFERFFVCPVCSPTRAEFLTGRYHARCGVTDVTSGRERLNLDEKTIADAFKAAGYATGAFGKWHNGSQWPYHPNARGFTEYYGFTSGHWGEYFNPPLEHNGQPVRGRGYIADDLTDHAVAFLEQNRDRPFFCYLPFNTPHSPFSVPDEYWARHETEPIALRGDLGADEDLAVTRSVLAMNENLDWNVGRVLRRLDELHLAENTVVLYFSDNGPASRRWNGGMKGIKGSVDEGGVRVPCFLRWPGKIAPARSIPQITAAIDLLPTLASLSGLPFAPAKPLDGADLSPLLLASAQSDSSTAAPPPPAAAWSDRYLINSFRGRTSVRTQQFRMDADGALFDMTSDPGQQHDLAAERPDVKAKMVLALAAWKESVGLPPAAGAGKRQPSAADDRPFPVGYPEFPNTPLPARDGVAHGGITRSAAAPNCSYFVNWKSPDDSITWDVEVHTAGDYEATLLYTCPAADTGATVQLTFQSATLAGQVAPGWDPPLLTGQDRAPRKGESTMKDFHPLPLGTIHLDPGRAPLTLRATQIPGATVMDLRQLNLTLRK